MSHTLKATAKMNHKELELIKKVGKNLGIKVEEVKNYKMYDGNIVSGIAIHLKNWKYPAILTSDNKLVYDNYNGAWGKETELDTFNNEYAAEKQRRFMREHGIQWEEYKNESTGEIEITMELA